MSEIATEYANTAPVASVCDEEMMKVQEQTWRGQKSEIGVEIWENI